MATYPWGFSMKQIFIYCSYNPKIADKFRITFTYPFLWGYHNFMKKRKLGLSAYYSLQDAVGKNKWLFQGSP